jgi:hypothetical protein
VEAIDIITAFKSGAISDEQAIRLIESCTKKKKSKKKPKAPVKMGRPKSKLKEERYKTMLLIWVSFRDAISRTKLRAILEDGLGVAPCYVSKFIASFNGSMESGYHLYRGAFGADIIFLILDDAELYKIIDTPHRAAAEMRRGEFLETRMCISNNWLQATENKTVPKVD